MTHDDRYDDCEASMLLLLVAHASADDGHELIEHLHPEIAGMVRSFFNRKDSRPIQPNVDAGPLYAVVPAQVSLPEVVRVVICMMLGGALGFAIAYFSGWIA